MNTVLAPQVPSIAPPTPDIQEIEQALKSWVSPGDVHELRALPAKRGQGLTVRSACFGHGDIAMMAKAAQRLNERGYGVYVTLNPVRPGLRRDEAAKDADVTRLKWLLIDIDSDHPAGASATDEQLEAALQLKNMVVTYLSDRGWPEPQVSLSGNGIHLKYRIDLPNNDQAHAWVSRSLVRLDHRFTDPYVRVDTSVSNASRIARLPGTVNKKGEHTDQTPHRRATILSAPEVFECVTDEQLAALSQEDVPPPTMGPAQMGAYRAKVGGLVLSDFLRRLRIPYKQDIHEGSERYRLEWCPFNKEHGFGESAIFRKPSGALAFKCFHNSCSGNQWQQVRELVDGPRYLRNSGDFTKEDPPAPPQWPEPMALPDALPPVQPFDPELLPKAVCPWVVDIAHRMQCPADFTAVAAVVALSSLIGARAAVAPKKKDDWLVMPNLWGMVVGRPGVMKSPALGEALKPLHRLEKTARERWEEDHAEWELDSKVAELAAKQNEKQAAASATKDPAKAKALLAPVDALPEPVARRYVVNDATVEKLGEVLEVHPFGTLVFRDELHGLLCSMDRQGQEGARGFYLQAYDGNQGYTVDRIMRGTHYIPRVCLAMLGGIQPGKAQSYVRDAVAGGAGDDGLLQRFGLAVWPDVTREFKVVDQWPDTQAKQEAWAVFERLNQLQPASDSDPQEWRFSSEAQDLYWQWAEPFETEIRGDDLHPALVSHLSKYRKLVPALALIFALVDTPDSPNVIEVRELVRALAWADYLRSHAERLYAAAVIPETAGAKQLLEKIEKGKLCDSDGVLLESFTPRMVAVKHWTGLGTVEAVRKAAELLSDYGWLVRDNASPGAIGGRPSDRYLIHPTLMKGGK